MLVTRCEMENFVWDFKIPNQIIILWKFLQRSVLSNGSKQQLELLAKYHQQVLETIDVFTIYFMQIIPRKTRK